MSFQNEYPSIEQIRESLATDEVLIKFVCKECNEVHEVLKPKGSGAPRRIEYCKDCKLSLRRARKKKKEALEK
jgi:hypothetical protein